MSRAPLNLAPLIPDGGLCAQTDPEVFFPEKGGSPRDAQRICARCEVRAECLRWALDRQVPHGVWGGLTARERRNVIARGTGKVA